MAGSGKLSSTHWRGNHCHQQFSFEFPNIFHLKNVCKPLYYDKELQPRVGLDCLVNSVSKPDAMLATRKGSYL